MKRLIAALAAGLAVLVLIFSLLLAGATSQMPAGGGGGALKPGSVPAAYAPLIEKAGQTCQAAPPAILAAQLETESGFRPQAVSPTGAQGLSQFEPKTWAMWGMDVNHDGKANPFDPVDAIPTQARYDCALAALMSNALHSGRVQGNLTALMLAAYNAGPERVLNAAGVPSIPETQAYVSRITTLAASYTVAIAVLPASPFASRLIAAAESQLGRPYVWGGGDSLGPTRGGWDCSGLVLYAAYQASGGRLQLPHFADTQTRVGTPVPITELQPGDVISFTSPGQTTAHHIGIYLGNNQMIHAPETGSMVQKTSLATVYWREQQWRVARYS